MHIQSTPNNLVLAERLTENAGFGIVWRSQRSRSLFRGTAPVKSVVSSMTFPGLRSRCTGRCDDA